MNNPLTDEVIDKAVLVFHENNFPGGGSSGFRKAMRAAAKVIESALAGDRLDAERLDKLEELAGEAYVSMCFEMDGGVHMTIEAPSSVPVAYRNKNSIRDALDAAIQEKNKFVPIPIEHEPDCNIRMASVERQMMGCDCKLSENQWKFTTAKFK